MASLPVLELGPDPRERGLAQGRQLAAAIRDNLETYHARFLAGGRDRRAVEAEGERWAAFILADNAEYGEEMRGIADGAGLSLAELAILNARYEITYSLFSDEAAAAGGRREAREQEGCTLYGLMPETTASGHCIIGQNWDWLAGLQGRTLVKRVRRGGDDARPDYVGYTEAGIVGCKMGVNAAGIGLCIAGLVTARDGANGMRKPLHVRCAEILDARRFDRALAPVVETDRTCSANFLIGHGDGEIIDIEATPDLCAFLYPQDGIVTHANHLVAERRIASQFERIAPGSLFRDQRLRRLLTARRGTLGLAELREALSDHFSAPAAICRHPDPDMPEPRRTATVAAVAIDLTARALHVTAGPACSHPFQTITLDAAAERAA